MSHVCYPVSRLTCPYICPLWLVAVADLKNMTETRDEYAVRVTRFVQTLISDAKPGDVIWVVGHRSLYVRKFCAFVHFCHLPTKQTESGLELLFVWDTQG